MLQKDRRFEKAVSGLRRELMLNCKLVPNNPKSPTLGSEKQPDRRLKVSGKRVNDPEEILEGMRVPLHPQSFPNATPSKAG
jgi:hypothetical protein